MHESGYNEFGNMVIDMKSFKYISHEIVLGKESKKIQLVTSQLQVQVSVFIKEFIERHVNMFIMSTWHDGRMRSLEYAEIHFLMVLYFQLLIWCISHIGMAQTIVKSKDKF